ncbi:MAG: hypothetical protein ABI599_11345 [Flavobacteriales bacterium]
MTRWILIALVALVPRAALAQSSGEFQFTLFNGSTVVRVLPPDWRPEFKGGFLYATPRDRFLTMDVLAVQPLWPDKQTGMHDVKVLFRAPLGARTPRIILVPDSITRIADAPVRNGFHVLGPQTLVRANSFTVEME